MVLAARLCHVTQVTVLAVFVAELVAGDACRMGERAGVMKGIAAFDLFGKAYSCYHCRP